MLLVWSVYPTFCIRQDDETIGRTPNPLASAIQDMGIDHRRFHVTMAQQLLHRSDVVAVLQQVRRKRMPEGMTTGWF